MHKEKTTHFGYQEVPTKEKAHLVGQVFSSVAEKYDLMNDLMSFGIHRFWKDIAVNCGAISPGMKILDLAGGSGDLTRRLSPLVGDAGEIILADINADMLNQGAKNLLDHGIHGNVKIIQANAEDLPFSDNYFNRIFIGFGLRNVTQQMAALNSMYRVLAPGGMLLILEFSKPQAFGLKSLYDLYSFSMLPKLGQWIANDADSYRYLAESIRMHPDQETLKNMMVDAGFEQCKFINLSGGIVAIHKGYKY